MRKKITFAFVLFGIFYSSLAQDEGLLPKIPNIPRSPEAASFMRYFELPVSYYTGTVDISIPIYTISSDGVEIPLVLSYHNSGVKVEEEASWVGLGWNLMVGGSITRKMKDLPDEFDTPAYQGMRVTNKFLDCPNFPSPVDHWCEYIECVNYDCVDYFNNDLA